jgi:transposase
MEIPNDSVGGSIFRISTFFKPINKVCIYDANSLYWRFEMIMYQEILRLHSLGINQSGISKSLGCARKTVRKVLLRAKEVNLKWPLEDSLSDYEFEKLLFPEKTNNNSSKKEPELDYIHKELMKKGVTLKLLWSEYMEECRLSHEIPLMYSQFCKRYQDYSQKKKASMHIPRKPGQQIEVDWAGDTAALVDRDTGELGEAQIFVGVLSYSQYAYVEAFPNQKQESWIQAHINMFRYFGGVSQIIVPDNLKTGVKKSDWYSPEINRVYQEMAVHYNTAIIPARVRKPKDKPNAEGTVKIISTWIVAAL